MGFYEVIQKEKVITYPHEDEKTKSYWYKSTGVLSKLF